MALLGDDGGGYELARKLENLGVWRAWLGDSSYSVFIHCLSSPAAWEDFMRPDGSKSRAQIHLQLRVRALLFDKASASLFLRLPPVPSSVAISKLNPSYLQLHGDDVYFTLDTALPDGAQQRDSTASSKMQSKSSFGVGSRELEDASHRFRNEDLPETWYHQFMEKYGASRSYKSSVGSPETNQRTPDEMSAYLKVAEKHKRKRTVFKDDQYKGTGNPMTMVNPVADSTSSTDDDPYFLPEVTFTWNSVPDSALPTSYRVEEKQKVDFVGIFDTLPQVATKSAVMIERLGIRPEYLNRDQGGGSHRPKSMLDGSRKHLGQDQASVLSQKVVARMLTTLGFEGASEVPMEILAQLLTGHLCKLGRILRVLADSYKKQCSAVELIKMFLQISNNSNLGALAELVKEGSRNFAQPSHQQMHDIQAQLQAQAQTQHPNPLRLPQQIPRQFHSQVQQMLSSHNMAFQQQQLEMLRRRQQQQQVSASRTAMDTDKMRPMVQVKVENPPDLPTDSNNAFNPVNFRQHPQMQFRQQQIAAMANMHTQQPSNQFRQVGSPQIPQMPAQSMGLVRAPPVKVEGFQELMGGDSALKHDSDESKLTSPGK
ncbi:uncharacterized protein LOC116201077 [Punica granatum]|uniref:Bromodomain associated domain-containing protein n=2 Tax=Punica granatum TaxID=22663 RepID=A0A218W0X2_PUNGR|nr:uncharacterized protein LOC116201077 [Punica granatum]OWM66203.1 hypothetical protein CDL15_Pgr013420 [Punica granatum]PKI61442.1 hypothetical protein CRG98_018125 [Punica granatum]